MLLLLHCAQHKVSEWLVVVCSMLLVFFFSENNSQIVS